MTATTKLAEALRNGIDAMRERIAHLQSYGEDYRPEQLAACRSDLTDAEAALAALETSRMTTGKLAEALRDCRDDSQAVLDNYIQTMGSRAETHRPHRIAEMRRVLEAADEALASWEAERAAPHAVITITDEDDNNARVRVAFHPSLSEQHGSHRLAALMLRAASEQAE